MDKFRFADGTVLTAADIDGRAEILPLTGTEGNDNFTGVAVQDHNNTIYGLGGNDTLTAAPRERYTLRWFWQRHFNRGLQRQRYLAWR